MLKFNRIITVTAVLVLGSIAAMGLTLPQKPSPERLVNDLAGAFSAEEIDSLESVLVDFDLRTSNQICVVTVSDLQGTDVAQYALRLANEWGVGSSRNNGVMILLMPRGADGYVDVTIQVGRGLEGAITDAYASRIIRNIMGPRLRQDRYMPAISRACAELMALAGGEISEPRDDEEEEGYIIGIIAMIVAIIIIVLLVRFLNKYGGGNGGTSGGSSNGGRGPVIIRTPHMGGNSFGGFSGGSVGGFRGFGGGSFGGGGASGRF